MHGKPSGRLFSAPVGKVSISSSYTCDSLSAKISQFISDMPCCIILFLHSNNSVSQNQKKHMGILLQLLEKHSAFLYEIRFQNATNSEQFHAHRIMVIVLFNIYQYR